jgi:membrane associated rhomboid family serine protease
MGIYDRDYYRRDMPEPVDDVPGKVIGLSMTAWLIIVNVAVFGASFLLFSRPGTLLYDWWRSNMELWPNFHYVPGAALFRPWQLVTCMFLHGGFWHILFNMWMLWIFGKGVEQLYGRWNYLAFYMVAGITASGLYVLTSWLRGTPNPAVGASGAVMGAVILFAFHFPRQRLMVWGIVPVMVWQIAVFYVVVDLLMFTLGRGGNVANAAHLGGAAFGAAYYFLDLRIQTLGKLVGIGKKSSRAPVPPPLPPTPRPGPGVDPHVRDRVDALLDKISRKGLTSLTDEERDFLRDASGKYRSS